MKLAYRQAADGDPVEEELEAEGEALQRACELLRDGATEVTLYGDDGALLRDTESLRAYCNAPRGSGGGGGGGRARNTVKITAAVFNERGQQFAVVMASSSTLSSRSEADKAWRDAMSLFRMPVVLTDGRRLHGDANLVRSFQRVDLRRIQGWREYTFTI